jgi:hypothetical protein
MQHSKRKAINNVVCMGEAVTVRAICIIGVARTHSDSSVMCAFCVVREFESFAIILLFF